MGDTLLEALRKISDGLDVIVKPQLDDGAMELDEDLVSQLSHVDMVTIVHV